MLNGFIYDAKLLDVVTIRDNRMSVKLLINLHNKMKNIYLGCNLIFQRVDVTYFIMQIT